MEVNFNKRDSNNKRKSSEINSILDTLVEDDVVIICNPVQSDLYGLGILLLEVKLKSFLNLDILSNYIQDLN